jgi:hypothetical protein
MFHRLEKLLVQIRAPAANCLRNPRIACNADNVGNIPLGDLNLHVKKWRQVLKFCLPSAVIIPMRAYSTIPLSGRSNLVRRYLLSRNPLVGVDRVTPPPPLSTTLFPS